MNALKAAALVVVLLSFFGIGVAHVIKPDWFVKRSGVRKGGELLSDWNRTQFQIVGAIFAGVAAYLRYVLFRG
jgi:hypothetical protein